MATSRNRPLRIGVIYDTHDFFDPQLPKLFAGVDHILHGGDIGRSRIILDLENIAPVTAVLGNNDTDGMGFRETEVVTLAERKFLVHHIVNPKAPADSIRDRIRRDRPEVVVFGHSHIPFAERIEGIFYFNPGYAGKSRFGLERTVAILQCDGKGVRHELLKL